MMISFSPYFMGLFPTQTCKSLTKPETDYSYCFPLTRKFIPTIPESQIEK